MSRRSNIYARGVRTRPAGARAGAALSSAEKLVLRALAALYKDPLQCAYGAVGFIAESAGYASDGYVRSIIASLEEAGIVQRMYMCRGRDKSQTTNLYDFPLMYMAAERPMSSEAESELQMRRAAFFYDRREGMPVQMLLKQAGVAPDSAAGGPPVCAAPVDREEEIESELPSTSQVPSAVQTRASVENCLIKARARATASAKATATTSVNEAARALREGAGKAGESSGAGGEVVRPWQLRERMRATGRRARAEERELALRDSLDGEDAAWYDEVTHVLVEIGALNDGLRVHVERAMRLHASRAGLSIAEVGTLAINRWLEYVDPGLRREWYAEPKKFFRDGLWLRPQTWKVSREWLAQRRAAVGGGGPYIHRVEPWRM